ncbi:hypothetical protein [Tahibacter harae]|uniref:Peptidase C-terminal archaeal/bacterial domain-containing protein n=1 Tax=Tahibacter harae TaxID=2963937 RepID=A0ABT1QY26_9GAMM|nr:hypothetical protein [Tahibacter harae]MCQ4167165.1 hypothetical protein [Tahibacter harae]
MNRFSQSFLTCGLFLALAGAAFAQTCASPGMINYSTPNAPTAFGDTCTGTSFFGDICDDTFPSPSNDAIYSFPVNNAGADGYTATNITLMTSSASFNPIIALLGPNLPCASSTPCLRSGSSGGVGAGEAVNAAGLANGSYFLLISGDPGSTTCGQYTVTVNGSLPVLLKNFAID